MADWDLYAVVRSCTSATANTTATASNNLPGNDLTNEKSCSWREDHQPLACLASLTFEEEDDPFSFPNLSQLRKSGSLQDSYKPFLPCADPTTIISTNQGIDPSSSTSVPGRSSGQHHQHQRLQQQQEQPSTSSIGINSPLTPTSVPNFAFGQSGSQQKPHHVHEQPQSQHQINPLQRQQQLQQQRVLPQEVQRPGAVLPLRNMQSQAPRSRKRKNQQKRTVCHVTADNLSSDPWAWRKYGQKPIKGSPYPRNYYRCSSSKGCSARKQVERSNLDPNIFIVSYTGDHTHPRPTHRNSLAGSTRNKLSTIQKAATKESAVPETLPVTSASCSSPPSSTSLSPVSPTTPLSAPEDTTAPVHNAGGNGGEEESVDMKLKTATDGESDEDDLLIPNVHADEDLFKGLEELVSSTAGAASTSSGSGRSPAFSDNFCSWRTGNSAPAGATAGGGC